MANPQTPSSLNNAGFRTVGALIFREMSSTYGRSAAGYLWALAEPVGGIVLLTVAFSFALRVPSLGDSFALFYASGFLPFLAFMNIQRKTASAIRFSRKLLYYPRVTFVDAIVARVILNTLTQMMISIIVFAAIIPLSKSHVYIDIPHLVWAYVMAVALGTGIGVLNIFLFWRIPAWERVWNVLMKPLYIGSAIFFIFESVPPALQTYLWFNPLVHVTGYARKGIYVSYEPAFVSQVYVFGLAAVCGVLGMLFLWRDAKEVVNG